jgi:hypothetical protein
MDSRSLGQLGAVIVSVLSLLIFVAMLPVALKTGNENMLLMLVGAAINMAGQGVSYWLGSSNSSAKKDETIASAVPTAPPAPPRL